MEGSLFERSNASANFKSSGRAKLGRVALVYSGDNQFALLDDVVTRLVARFQDDKVPVTIATLGGDLARDNAINHLRRWEATHALRIHIPDRRYYNGVLMGFQLEFHAFDLSDGERVWTYFANVVSGDRMTVEAVIASAFRAMASDGVR
jgi:hypothetical protein